MWEMEGTDEFVAWFGSLTPKQKAVVIDRVDMLAAEGPLLRRPYVGEIKTSAFAPRMKELVCEAGGDSLRVLFIFDPRRTAILLLGGNKTGRWNEWYRPPFHPPTNSTESICAN